MAESKPITAADLIHWKPTEENRMGGFRCYAHRVMFEAKRFEEAGDQMNANLRYEKMKAYCKLRGIEYPPGSTPETCLIPAKEWVKDGLAEAKDVPVDESALTRPLAKPIRVEKIGGRPKKRKRKKRAYTWTQEGQDMIRKTVYEMHARRFLRQKGEEFARAYCLKNNIDYEKISVEASGVPGEPATGSSLPIESRATDSPAGVSPVVVGESGAPAPLAGDAPVPLETLSLKEQLRRQLAEIDAAERAEAEAQRALTPEAVVAPQKPEVVVAPPVAPVAEPEPVKAKETPLVAPVAPKGVRLARVHNFCLNPRLAGIQFEDEGQEWGSMWIDRLGLSRNDVLPVTLAEGVPGVNAIYQEVQKPR